MTRLTVLLLTLLWLRMLAGCTDDVRQGMYEGFRTRNDLQTSPSERVGRQEVPDYREYEQLRKKQKE